jgi:hypothetical protein
MCRGLSVSKKCFRPAEASFQNFEKVPKTSDLNGAGLLPGFHRPAKCRRKAAVALRNAPAGAAAHTLPSRHLGFQGLSTDSLSAKFFRFLKNGKSLKYFQGLNGLYG